MPAGAIFISFDAVAVSGITVEALKIAKGFDQKGVKLYLDLGYDIKIDKGNFNKPYSYETHLYKDIFTLVRVEAIDTIPHYNVDFIEHSHGVLIAEKIPVSSEEKHRLVSAIQVSAQALAQRIVQQWDALDIRYVIVENGTLPENIIYTQALYLAIEAYGNQHDLGNFVIWRDHDLMWSSEKSAMKYGPEPYTHAVKPVRSRHISYVTLNNDLKSRLEAWCNHEVEVKVRKNTYDFSGQNQYSNIKERLDIRDTDILIARTTRIIPQKRQDRDIYLVQQLNQRFADSGSPRRVYLAVAGDPQEHPVFFNTLNNLVKDLQVEAYVKFIGSLSHDVMRSNKSDISIEDLYYSCDLVSFLTSWGYDSYGNPVGEAISSRRCYIATRYEYYQEVYGQHGFEAPVMAITEEQDGLPDEAFINEV